MQIKTDWRVLIPYYHIIGVVTLPGSYRSIIALDFPVYILMTLTFKIRRYIFLDESFCISGGF